MDRRIWQIGSGQIDRSYSKLFEDCDIMCLGPGEFGKLDEDKKKYELAVKLGQLTKNNFDQLNTFKNTVKSGDVVLLRSGYKVIQIGVIPSDEDGRKYFWSDVLDDVYGWDLQHVRRVVWQMNLKQELVRIQSPNANNLFQSRKQIPAFTSVQDKSVLNPIRHLFERIKNRELKPLPENISKKLELEEIGTALFEEGLSNDSVDKVISLIARHRRLIQWYNTASNKSRPTEHEVVAYLVLPLLIALGWSEQLVAVEWLKIDLAAFESTPTTEESCVLICEAKVKGHGLQNVLEQAKKYVNEKKLVNAKKIILTDGMRIYLHERLSSGNWSTEPAGYINLMKIRTNHLLPKNTNAIETLVSLTPAKISLRLSKSH